MHHDSSELQQKLENALGSLYKVERELGRGGMSRVFLAHDRSLGREIVVKLLLPELAAGVSIERFRREIALVARLQHPNIVPVLAAGDADGLPFFTMPFVRGESLRALLEREKRLGIRQTIRIMRDVASALACAHAEGVVHRDIKPDNVLLASGAAMVTDFGVAKALSSSRDHIAPMESTLTTVGTSLGTPAYMAPEQASADPSTDHRADFYALGVMVYEMLAGCLPFDCSSLRAAITAHLTQTPPPLTNHRNDVPPALAALVMKCLEKDPADRPQSASAIVHELDELGGVRTGAHETAVAARPRASRRRRWPAVAAVLALAIAIPAAVVWNQRMCCAPAPVNPPVRLTLVPFQNLGTAQDAYFADGLSEAIANRLARVPAIALIDRRAANVPAGATLTELGGALDVQYVLTGSVRWAADTAGVRRAQVTPSLMRVDDGTTVWSPEPYIVTSTDVFEVQTRIATQVAEALDVALGPRDRQALADRPTENAAAYDAYLRGLDYFRRSRETSLDERLLRRAIDAYEDAVRLDPRFAVAFAKLAEARYWWASLDTDDESRMRQFRRALDQAVALGPELPEVKAAQALAVEH